MIDPTIKYGGGDDAVRELLRETSEMVATFEDAETELAAFNKKLAGVLEQGREEFEQFVLGKEELDRNLENAKRRIREIFAGLLERLEGPKS